MEMYVIFDVVKLESSSIQFYKNQKEAVRAYHHIMNAIDSDPKSVTSSGDFELYYLGDYDMETMVGSFVPAPVLYIPTVDDED